MKIVRLKTHLIVVLEDGTMLTNTNCTDELYDKVVANLDNEDEILRLLVPTFLEKKEEYEAQVEVNEELKESSLITYAEGRAYLKEISNLILPQELATAIVKAEKEGNTEQLESYKNFWTLCSLNPNAEARKNLFWFLNKYGMKISKSGLFVVYRNANLKNPGEKVDTVLNDFISEQYARVRFKLKKSPKNYFVGKNDKGEYAIHLDSSKLTDVKSMNLLELYAKLSDEDDESPTYTDQHSGKTVIKLGKPVTLPRDQCDENQNVTCSRGLHVAGKSWLSQGYYGQVSLMCLVNPADVVAVPPKDNYGKMRVCAYYPVHVIKRDKDGRIIDEDYDSGFEDDFMGLIAYDGIKNEKENLEYTLQIPKSPDYDRKKILSQLDTIAKSMNKYVK